MKRLTKLFLLAILIITLAACSSVAAQPAESAAISVAAAGPVGSTATELDQQQTIETAPTPISVEYDEDDLETSTNTSDLTRI
jgi:ABC-type molybdate transport system substrate-binding protein